MKSVSPLSGRRLPGPLARALGSAVLVGAALVLTLAASSAALAGPAAAQPAAGGTSAAQARTGRTATSYAATIRDGRATVAQELAQTPGASLSLALVRDGRVIWRQGWGYADRAAQTAPGPDTMFGIASVSKIICTVAVMKLVDEGKVDLDTPVFRYLPTFTMADPQYQNVTVRMLLDHASGLPGADYYNGDTTVYFPGYLAQVLQTLAQARLKTTPGFMSVYCNQGFALAEAVVQEVSGQSYADYTHDEIFAPLGMTRTACPVTESVFAGGDWARAYDGDQAKPHEVSNAMGSGGVYSTPSDLGKLGTMLMDWGMYEGRRFLSRAAVTEMGTSQVQTSFDPRPSAALDFGLGWDTVTEPASYAAGVISWAKNGGIVDYHSSFMVSPKGKLSVAVVATTPFDTDKCDAIARRILVHALKDQGTIAKLPGPVATTAPPVKKATEAQLTAVEGVYARADGVYRVARSATDPQALETYVLAGGEWLPFLQGLRLRSDGRFHAPGSATGVFGFAADGRRYLGFRSPGDFAYYDNTVVFAEKLRPNDPMTDAWQQRVGHTWLLVDALPTSSSLSFAGAPLLQVGEIPDTPGFVTVTTLDYATQTVDASHDDDVATMFLQIPMAGSRDIQDAVIERHDAEDWVRWSGGLFRPLEGVPELAPGASTVSFGPEGYAEWRKVTAATKLHIAAGTAWLLYDEGFTPLGRGTTLPADVTAPAGSWLLLYGPAGGSVTVTAEAS